MKTIALERERATLEISMEELGLIQNALWHELGYQEQRTGSLEDELRESYDAFQRQIGDVIAGMDDLADDAHTPSDRLRSLVTSRTGESYLEHIDGYWADAVLSGFSVLEDRGYDVAVDFHQEDDSVRYTGPRGQVWASLMLDTGSMTCSYQLDGVAGPMEALIGGTPVAQDPVPEITRESIDARVAAWAAVIRDADERGLL